MRTLSKLLIVALLSPTLACLDAPPEADTSVDEAELEVTPVLLCGDTHATIPGESRDCVLHGGGTGIRLCTDHITFHWSIAISPTFPPSGPQCIANGVDVRTTCGPCQDLDLPGGPDGPGGPLDP